MIAVLGGCKTSDVPYYSVDPLAKSIFNWDVGSYWIMQDSTTGQIDSFYVVSYSNKTNHAAGGYNNEAIHINIDEVNLSVPSTITPWSVDIGGISNFHNLYFGYNIASRSDSSIAYTAFFSSVTHSNTTLIRNGKTYSSVYYDDSIMYLGHVLNAAVNPSDGLIWIRSYYGTYNHVWDLKNKKIVRPK